MMNFTIIVPFYNSVCSIERLLNSIPTNVRVEIIIIDDNSKWEEFNELKQIVSSCEYRNIILLQTKRNLGAGAARNLGLQIARGKWLIFADADDFFMPELSKAMYKYANVDEDIIYFNATSIKIPTKEPSNRHKQIEKWINDKDDEALRYKFHGPVCKFVKTELIRKHKILFYESFAFNDALFSAQIGYYANKIIIDNSIIYCITESKNSTTYTVSRKIINSRILATIEVNKFYRQVCLHKYQMPIFPHWIYSRKLGIFFFFKVLYDIIKIHENPFRGISESFHCKRK